ncbi:hypothetical protein Tco_0754718 [Tanacetum coccineum]
MLAVCNTYVHNLPKAPKPSSSAERVPQGTKPGAKPGYKKHSTSSTQPSVSSSKATKVVAEMHKEDQQVARRPTSLRVTSKERAYPHLSSGMSAFTYIELVFLASYIFHSESASGNDASADFTTEVDPEISAPNDYVPHQQGPDEGSKYYTPDHTFAGTNLSILVYTTKSVEDGSQTAHPISGTKVDTRTTFMEDEHQDNEPFIAPEESSEENVKRIKDTHNQKLEQDKQKVLLKLLPLKLSLCFQTSTSSLNIGSIPTELKELPTKITALSGEVNELKKHIKEFEIELPETLEALLGLLNKLIDTLNRFSNILNAHNEGVPSAGKSTTLPAKGEKNTNPVTEDAELANLVDLIGIDVVEEYHKKKLLNNNYCDKMLKRKKNSKITNCEILIKKGPITLKIYREDGSEVVISNLKTRVDQLTQTEQELKIDLNKPLKEQDPLNELNELANKKRKRASDFSNEPRSAKKVMSSVQQ